MRKSILIISLLLAVCMATTAFAAPQQQGEGEDSELMTQGEFAQKMVRMLGLYRYLPPDPTDGECFAILMVNKVTPEDGWVEEKLLTREDLAMVVVKAMGQEGSVENPDDPQSWVDTLQALGVPIEAVGQAVNEVSATEDFKSTGYGPAPSDPVKQQRMLGEPDERQMQSDMGNVTSPLTSGEVKLVLQGIDPNDVKPEPVTPN